MIAKQRPQTVAAAPPLPPDFMLPDPPMIPDFQRNAQRRRIDPVLACHFMRRDDILVAGGGYLRLDPMNDGERYAPDCLVAFGVDPEAIIARNGYLIGEVGKPPDFALDVAAQCVGMKDRAIERETYERYQAREYWRLDAATRWQAAPLAGDRLTDGGKYAPIEIAQDADGRLWGYGEALALKLCWDGEFLRFHDAKTDRFLPDAVELAHEIDAANARAAEARARIANARADFAEAEVRRLRALLRNRE